MKGTDLELAELHKYRNLAGDICINVTGVTGLLDDDGKSSKMAGAAAKIAKEGGNYRTIWNEKMKRGTRVHAACEAWLRGKEADVEADDTPYIDALAEFFKDKNPQPIEIERVVLSDLGYGGRFDFIATFDGQDTLVDVKTGRPYFIEHCLQLSAYRYADGMAVYNTHGDLAYLEPMPNIDRAGCLYLDADGNYDFRTYPADEDKFDLFCHLLWVKKGLVELKKVAV